MVFGWTEIAQNVIYFVSLYYAVFWLLVFLEKKTLKKRRLMERPEVSIVIPAYNEEPNVIPTLNSVVSLKYPRSKIKIIFIDDGSKDNTYQLATDHCNKLRKKYQYKEILVLTQKNAGKYAAMNNALQYVDTEFFATLDADSFPESTALQRILTMFDSSQIAAVSPVLKVYQPKNKIQLIQGFEYFINHFYKSLICRLNAIHVVPGPLSVYRTNIVKQIGGFHEAHKTEDMEIAMRLQEHQYRIVQCDDAFVYTKTPQTIRELYVQRHRWNYGTFKNLLDYRRMLFNKKYGDFGFFQLPVILISGFLTIFVLFLILYDLIKGVKPFINMMTVYNFNIFQYIRQSSFHLIWLDIDVKSIVTFGVFLCLSILIVWLAFRIYKEKFYAKRSVSLVMYLFFYYLFLAVVWIGVFKDYVLRRETRWKK
jgi:cellulose synthase/poly-beta-1,6-N-acetylglucosamine synthase-like glycosyltransferase